MDANKEILELLKAALCPAHCDKGAIPHQVDDYEWEFEQCQFCHERDQAIAALEAQGAEPDYDAALGKAVSVDVSTGDEDASNRIFAEIVEWQGDGQGDIIFLAINGERNHSDPPSAQAAAVPDAMEPGVDALSDDYVQGWNACRDAMLNAAPAPAQKSAKPYVLTDGQWAQMAIPSHAKLLREQLKDTLCRHGKHPMACAACWETGADDTTAPAAPGNGEDTP